MTGWPVPARVASRLGFVPGTAAYRYAEELAANCPDNEGIGGTGPAGLEPLDPREVAELCHHLGLSPEDTADAVATLPTPERTPEWWWCVERAVARLVARMGDIEGGPGIWPGFVGPGHDLARRCHFLHVALAVVPSTVAFLRGLAVPEPTAWASVSDVARHAAIHRRTYGTTGVDADWWVSLCLRGVIVELGRLQYNPYVLSPLTVPAWYGPDEADLRGQGFRMGDRCLGIHIPDGPPLRPDVVQESLELASDLFSTRVTYGARRIATCRSWLLDPQLADHLGQGANIVSFQRRFELVPGCEPGDDDVLQFVFRSPAAGGIELGSLPRRTAMERAAVDHLAAGRHWFRRTGWLELLS